MRVFVFILSLAIAPLHAQDASKLTRAKTPKEAVERTAFEMIQKQKEEELDLPLLLLSLGRAYGEKFNLEQHLGRLKKEAKELEGKEMVAFQAFMAKKKLKDRSTMENTAKGPEVLFLNHVLEKKGGYCTGLVSYYLALAQLANLPIKAVLVPGHVMVAWANEGKLTYLETLENGEQKDLEYYKQLPTTKGRGHLFEDGLYPKVLSHREFLALVVQAAAPYLEMRGEGQKAEDWYRYALGLAPDLEVAHFNLAYFYMLNGRWASALEEFQLLINKFDPKNPDYHTYVGASLSNLDKQDEAIKSFDKAIVLEPKHFLARNKRAYSLFKQHKKTEAIDELSKVMAENKDDYLSYYYLGLVSLDFTPPQCSDAKKLFQEAEKRVPTADLRKSLNIKESLNQYCSR